MEGVITASSLEEEQTFLELFCTFSLIGSPLVFAANELVAGDKPLTEPPQFRERVCNRLGEKKAGYVAYEYAEGGAGEVEEEAEEEREDEEEEEAEEEGEMWKGRTAEEAE